jgi:hypothetical protein
MDIQGALAVRKTTVVSVAHLEYLSGLVLYHQGLDLLELLPLQLLLLVLKACESG